MNEQTPRPRTMYELFPNFTTTDSLFQPMVELGAPWSIEIAKSMDISYFTMHSGIDSPSMFSYLNKESGQIPVILWDMFGANWTKLWNGYQLKYNPVNNYNVDETVSRNQTNNRTINKDGTFNSTVDGTGTNKTTITGTDALEHGQVIDTDINAQTFTFGFNSSDQVPTGVTTQTNSETHSGTDTTTSSSETNSSSTTQDKTVSTSSEDTTDKDNIDESITRNRSGNIGQNTYQELLRQEFELWKWNFYWRVFADCDKMLSLELYDLPF